MNDILDIVSLISGLFTIGASGIAIYLFLFKRKAISSVFELLMNYSYQFTLAELKEKLERLNDNNAKDPDQCENIVNILNELLGQIRGNDKLKGHFYEEKVFGMSSVLDEIIGTDQAPFLKQKGEQMESSTNGVKSCNQVKSKWVQF